MPSNCGVVTVVSSDTPGGTPGETPGGTPGETPGGTPGETPGDTPQQLPEELPYIGPLNRDNPRAVAAGGVVGAVLLSSILG